MQNSLLTINIAVHRSHFLYLIFSFSILTFTLNLKGANYYVDATNGYDQNTGLAPASAWQTISKVNKSYFLPGDNILFKRGEIWREQLVVSSSGAPGNPITFGVYGDGEKTVISGADKFHGWIQKTKNVWYVTGVDIEPKQTFFNGSKGFFESNTGSIDRQYEWFWTNAGEDTLFVYAQSLNETKNIESTNRDFLINLNGKDYINIYGLNLKQSNDKGIKVSIEASTHIKIAKCDISYTAGIGIMGYSNSTSWEIYDNTLEYIGWELKKDAIYLWGGCDNWKIYNNTITMNKGDGVNLGQEGDQGDVQIYNNTFGPTTSTIAFGIAAESNSVTGTISIFENKFLGHNYGAIQIKAKNVKIYRNIIDITSNATDVTIQTNHTNTNTGLEIYYNLILSGDEDASSAIYFNIGGSNSHIYNNVITGHNHGININKARGVLIKNNIIYENQGIGIIANDGYSATISHNDVYKNKDGDYNAIIGDQTGSNGNISKNPLFMSFEGDFHLSANSPCIDNGINVEIMHDISGTKLPQGTEVDMGVFEFIRMQPPMDFHKVSP